MCTCYGQMPTQYKFLKEREEKDAVGMPASTLVRTEDTAGVSITKTKEVVLDRLDWSSFSTYRIEHHGILRVHICLIAGGRDAEAGRHSL